MVTRLLSTTSHGSVMWFVLRLSFAFRGGRHHAQRPEVNLASFEARALTGTLGTVHQEERNAHALCGYGGHFHRQQVDAAFQTRR